MKAVAQLQKRRVITVETSKFVSHALQSLDSEYYNVRLMEGFSFSDLGKFQNIEKKSKKQYVELQEKFFNDFVQSAGINKWSVVFIDHSPGFLRVPAIRLFANLADYVVTHDTEALQHYSFADAFKEFKYISHCKWFKPFTTVMSNYIDLSCIDPLVNFSAEQILEEILLDIGIKTG